jgi:hypothetical protein
VNCVQEIGCKSGENYKLIVEVVILVKVYREDGR